MYPIKNIPSLEDIAVQIRTLAIKRAPIDTGNLKSRLLLQNSIKNMVKYTPHGAEFSLDFSPTGASYGKYWNTPYGKGNGTTATIKKRYPQHFDYAEKAITDPSINAYVKEFVISLTNKVKSELIAEIRLV
jgi:hypothetical protein